MTKRPNILFIMADQLRADYLSCYGHPTLETPNLDWLASRGVRFNRAYAQSAVCGPARMSVYTGRYVLSHGSTLNDTPLRQDEWTIGDFLRPLGYRTVLVGKTHMRADVDGMEKRGIDPASPSGLLISEAGFETYSREEGIYLDHWPAEKRFGADYNRYLRERGYDGENPWHEWVNSVEIDGVPVSGWLLETAPYPARVQEEDSETPYLTRRAIECIDALESDPWCLHLSYIKPHWPYVAPAPYHATYSENDVLPAIRTPEERVTSHSVFAGFQRRRVSQSFSDDAVRTPVVAAYMGLVKQLDDQLGVLFGALKERGLMENTLIVFTSDHGDYLGDHWLGEKEFLHEPSIRVPMIVVDPREPADATRGLACDALVEAIDLLPTFVEAGGGDPGHPRLEGHSLIPLLDGQEGTREYSFCEFDYATMRFRRELGQAIDQTGIVAVVGAQWKLIACPGFEPLLFDLVNDPHELTDRAGDPGCAEVRAELEAALRDWALRPRRVTESAASIERRTDTQVTRGIKLGIRNSEELDVALREEAQA
ncbi:sulfatase-like hydrolase/transferase [Novosphingobium sp. ERW19]|uniref:sulfatase-like hydrolase/transferase n=1 Tax=Novosphingobium sp. ERW19 TaxID=2726186 RepID=UPI00145721BB|nr:sulfatase-like hydrolase/transferase [Novosphingobium sp. ERW19]NLR41136.1 sulfatase-like hydrolase/transferase [Novosphingobium sp. ERW19]